MKYGYCYYDQPSNKTLLRPGVEAISSMPIKIGIKSYWFEGYASSIVDHLLKNKDTEVIAQGIDDDGHWKEGAAKSSVNIIVNKVAKSASSEISDFVRKSVIGASALPYSVGSILDLCDMFSMVGEFEIIKVPINSLIGKIKDRIFNEKIRLELSNYISPNIHGEYGPDIIVDTKLSRISFGELARVLITGKRSKL